MRKKSSMVRRKKRTQRQKYTKKRDVVHISDMLRRDRLQRTIKKAKKQQKEAAYKTKRRDPQKIKTFHDRHKKLQKQRRDRMSAVIATAERKVRMAQDVKPNVGLRDDIHTRDRICGYRIRVRKALFAKNRIGSGKGIGNGEKKKRKIVGHSFINCR